MLLLHYLKTACRSLWEYKIQNLIGVLGVAVGLVCFTLCSYIPRFLAGWDRFHPDVDRMYVVTYKGDFPSIDLRQELKDRFPGEIEKVTFFFPYMNYHSSFESNNSPNREYELKLVEADTSLISFFSLKLLAGSIHQTTHSANSIILFESFAKKIGKPKDLLGQKIITHEKVFYITGILKDIPKNSFLRMEDPGGFVFNVSDGFFERAKTEPVRYDVDVLSPLILLKKGASTTHLQKELHEFARLKGPEEDILIGPYDFPFMLENQKTRVSIIVIIGFLILLTGLLNYISFLTTQCYNRLDNYAIRKVNGAGRKNLFFQIFSDFLIIWLLAGILSFFLKDLFIPYFELLKGQFVYYDASIVRMQLFEYVLLGIPCIALLCIAPVLSVEKLSVKTTLLGIVGKGNRMIVRDILLFIQMLIFLGFMSALALVSLQMNKTYSGIFATLTPQEKTEIFLIPCYKKKPLMENREIILRKIQLSPLVEKAIFTNTDFYHNSFTGIDMETGGRFPWATRMYISPEFLDFFHVKLLSGRFFDDRQIPGLAVVDERFAALYGEEGAIGKTFLSGTENRYTIIGVVQNVTYFRNLKNSQFHNENNPLVYYLSEEDPWNSPYIYVKALPGKENEVKKYINQCLREFVPETIDVEIRTLDSQIRERVLENESALRKTGTLFACIALAICFMSLYSSVTLNTERRRKEVAIRKINGANIRNIVFLFVRKYFIMLTIASLLVFLLVYAIGNNWLEQYIERVSLNWIFFLGIYIVALLLVLLTVIFRVLKVAGENPVEGMKLIKN